MTFASASSSSCGAQGAVGDRSAATRRANSRGAMYPRLLCGRSLLYSSFHAPIFAAPQTNSRTNSRSGTCLAASRGSFHVRVLYWPSRFDVHQLNLPLQPPRQKMPTRKFRSVVAPNRFRNSSLRYDPLQLPCHPSAGRTRVKIQGPFLVCSRHPARATPVRTKRLLFFQLQLQPPVSPSRLLSRRFLQPLSQRFVVPPAHIPLARFRHSYQLADPPLTHQKMLPQPVHFLPPLYELHPFFSIIAFSMSCPGSGLPPASSTAGFHPPAAATSAPPRRSSPPYFAFHA